MIPPYEAVRQTILSLVRTAISKVGLCPGVTYGDVVSRAHEVYAECIASYDPSRGMIFNSWLHFKLSRDLPTWLQKQKQAGLTNVPDGECPGRQAPTDEGYSLPPESGAIPERTWRLLLSRLTDQQRQIAVALYRDGRDPHAVCEEMGLSMTKFANEVRVIIAEAQEMAQDAPGLFE